VSLLSFYALLVLECRQEECFVLKAATHNKTTNPKESVRIQIQDILFWFLKKASQSVVRAVSQSVVVASFVEKGNRQSATHTFTPLEYNSLTVS